MSAMESVDMNQQIEELLSKGLIRDSMSPCAILVLLTPQKYGRWRIYTNSRVMDKVIVKCGFLFPRMDDLLEILSGIKYFTKIGLKSGLN